MTVGSLSPWNPEAFLYGWRPPQGFAGQPIDKDRETRPLTTKHISPHTFEAQLHQAHPGSHRRHPQGLIVAGPSKHPEHGDIPPRRPRGAARHPGKRIPAGYQEKILQGCVRQVTGHTARGQDRLADIPHMPSKFVEFVPLSHRQGNCIPYAAIRWHDFGNRPALGRPLGHFSRHPDTPLLSLSPRRRFPRPTPERVFVADHQSSSGFSGTGPSAPPPQPIGT